MNRFAVLAIVSLFALPTPTASASTIFFSSDPFAGSTALGTPGRQVVGGEPSITFNPGVDQFQFDLAAFGPYGVGPTILFVNDVVSNIPGTNVNTVVLRTFDNDANLATPFGAGNAATLIADRVTTMTPGFFIYFNQGLDLPRLVFSTSLDDSTADLKILARITNLTGASGQTAMANFTSANFDTVTAVPDSANPLGIFGFALGCVLLAAARQRKLDRGASDPALR